MEHQPFTIAQMRPIRDCMTVSRPANLGKEVPVTWFSLGAGTTITPESYDCTTLYVGAMGNGRFILGEDGRAVPFAGDDFLAVPAKTLCGTSTDIGMIYTEIILKKENTILNNIADNMKFVLMAFDAGTSLPPHRAPGNAILTALEGKAIIGYEGQDYKLNAGESFRFDKNGLHSVTPQGKFKMSLLLVIE